jgi:PTS system nitrogen regulatory IIA component
MNLKIHEAARLLGVDADEVSAWIRDKGLPAHKFQEQYRINSVELQEWALEHGVRIPPELTAVNRAGSGPAPDLVAALERGGLHAGVPGRTRDEVLAAVAALPGIPEAIDRELLLQLLLAREMLASTGVGGGIALPHPRSPIVLDVELPPTLLLCFPEQPVDFKAVDGKPVWALFLLLSPTIQDHLRMLSQLSYALHDKQARTLLEQRAPLADLLAHLRAMPGRS